MNSAHERDLLHTVVADGTDTLRSFRNKNGQEDIMSDVSDLVQKQPGVMSNPEDLVSGRVVLTQIAILVVTLIVVALVAAHRHI